MKRSALRGLAPFSAYYVATHAHEQEKRGKRPSLSYCGVRNATRALNFALLSLENGTEVKEVRPENLCYVLFEDFGPSEEEIAQAERQMEDPELFKRALEEFLQKEDEENIVATLSDDNSLVVAKGDDVEVVLSRARKIGVENPHIVYLD